MKHKPTPPQLPRLTASQRANLLMSLGVIKAPGIRPYRVSKRPPPTDKPTSTRKLPVHCIDTGEVFDSITAAALAHKVRPSHLSSHLKGYLHTVGKRRYEYVKGEEKQVIQSKPFHSTAPRGVRCLDDGKEFRSINACARHYKIGTTNLYCHLNGNLKSVGQRRFEFI